MNTLDSEERESMKQANSHTLRREEGHLPSSIPPHISHIVQRFAQESKALLQENIIAEFLFGSYAKDTYTSISDVDILILVNSITPDIRRQLSGLASDYSLEYDIYLSPIIKDREVWKRNAQCQTLFYQEIMQHGISL